MTENIETYILEEAEKLFMKYGTKSITMDDIAKQLGMSKKTIYANFKDKDELVTNLIISMMQKDECNMAELTNKSENAIDEIFLMMDFLKEMLANINPVIFYDLEKYHNKAYKIMMEFHENHIYKNVKICLERGIKENVFRDDINTEILSHARVAQINWTFETDLIRSGKHSLYEVIQELTTHFLFGICTLSGHILINNYTNKNKQTI
ncbi:TetR/AcrR family transcriptional regulator [Pedobacter sp. SD-b]|uniref:TetR/AcrR family transcriptional regulator n=1 Tax=Pedobacter segetis TaxID=2793069 RepID=A0ABS1BFK3_9SPHI|nr:TetR/AcrR family transcriptional regulator [Pedobacter segetis]MBK0381627.1 TetR/AcrR family transcriptional regulator [Pedobacter segetis]